MQYTISVPNSDFVIIGVEIINNEGASLYLSNNIVTLCNINNLSLSNLKLKINYRVLLSSDAYEKLIITSQIVDLY